MQGFRLVTRRAELLRASRLLDVAALDEYAFVRDAYLQRRRFLGKDGEDELPDYLHDIEEFE